jgi:excisionase family DNA binding protein
VSISGRLLTARDVAARLSLSAETVLRWHRRGDLPGVRLSSNVLRFAVEDVEAFVADRYGRGKARRSALTPAEGDSTPPLLPFDPNPSRLSRRETAKHNRGESHDE